MRQHQLFEILGDLALFFEGQKLIVVGSQSAYGQLESPPQVVVRSIEVDVLLRDRFDLRDPIEERFGADSAYQAEHGIYAHPLGIGIVTLPRGWEERLVPISDDDGVVRWWALEIHDTAASKLIAGRDKDFDFIVELTYAEQFRFDTFLERAALLIETAHAQGLRPRVQKLIDRLASLHLHKPLGKARDFFKTLPP